tara:strand:- start:4103 stop:4237 length:135 start_codon:yes stop_codon:yes gene_type:complete
MEILGDTPSLIEQVMATKVMLKVAEDEDNPYPIVLVMTRALTSD